MISLSPGSDRMVRLNHTAICIDRSTRCCIGAPLNCLSTGRLRGATLRALELDVARCVCACHVISSTLGSFGEGKEAFPVPQQVDESHVPGSMFAANGSVKISLIA